MTARLRLTDQRPRRGAQTPRRGLDPALARKDETHAPLCHQPECPQLRIPPATSGVGQSSRISIRGAVSGVDELHWFTVSTWSSSTLSAAREQLSALGVRVQEPLGLACYYVEPTTREILKEIGTIAVAADQRIDIFPRWGIDNDDHRALLGSAEQAFHRRPTSATGWNRHRSRSRGTWWSADIVVPVDATRDTVGQTVARQQRSYPAMQRSHQRSNSCCE